MTGRALLLGSQLTPLTGIANDLDLMGDLLAARGFTDIRRHENAAAARRPILDAFVDLVADTAAGDPVAIYYSGHGGLALNTADRTDTAQYIAPTDYPESTVGDFRGITDLELSMLVAALTRKTSNVSVILDCCHSALMARDPGMVDKAIPASSFVDIAAHHAQIGAFLLQRGLPANAEGNEDAVRLVACGQRQSTKEFETAGMRVGMFTSVLCRLLEGAGTAPLTWAGLVAPLRTKIRLLATQQSPAAEGPSARLLFTDTDGDITGVLGAVPTADGAALDGGTLAGVSVADRYAAVPPGDGDLTRLIGMLDVRSVTVTGARAALTLQPGQKRLPNPADARPVIRATRRMPVVVAADPALDPVRAAVGASLYVEPVAAPPTGEPVLASVELDGGALALGDGTGPVVEPVPANRAGEQQLVGNLDRLARAAAARALDTGDAGMRAMLDVTWGTVERGVLHDLEASGETLFVGDSIFVRLRNVGHAVVHAFVFAVDAGGGITLLTSSQPTGVALVPTQERIVTRRDPFGAPTGLLLGWPDAVSRVLPRLESLLVIAMRAPADLRMLAQGGVQGPLRAGASSLEEAIYQIAGGGTRSVRAPDASSAVWHIDYLLVPAGRPAAEAAPFLVDERPDVSVALLAARPRTAAAHELAVGLEELRVRPEHPLYGPGLRLDVLVGTAPAVPGDPLQPATATIRLADPQPGADLVVAGEPLCALPARDHLGVAVWLSRDPGGAATLEDLLPAPPAVGGGSPMAVAVAQLAAAGVLVDQAADALEGVAADVAGLYRGSFAADAATGPHPTGALGTEQRITLRFRVDAV